MAAVWTFHQYPAEGLQYQPLDNTLRTPNDVGDPFTRPRTSKTCKLISYERVVGGADFQSVMNFYELTLLQGSLPFERPDPLDGVSRLMKFEAKPAGQLVRPGSNPFYYLWMVSIALRVLPA